MKCVRLTISADSLADYPAFELLTDPSVSSEAETLYWNVDDEGKATVLVRIDGDTETITERFGALESIELLDVMALDTNSTLVSIQDHGTDWSRRLLRTFTREGLIVVPPVRYTREGASVTIVGERATIQTAIDDLPEEVTIAVERIAEATSTLEPATTVSDRQREAAVVALELGYFDVPRRVGVDAVAAELGCTPSTAAEHLQKAQSRVMKAHFD